MRNDFEDEIKGRFENYSREPEEQMWNNLVPHLPKPVNPKWYSQGADILTGLSILLFLYITTPIQLIGTMDADLSQVIKKIETLKSPSVTQIPNVSNNNIKSPIANQSLELNENISLKGSNQNKLSESITSFEENKVDDSLHGLGNNTVNEYPVENINSSQPNSNLIIAPTPINKNPAEKSSEELKSEAKKQKQAIREAEQKKKEVERKKDERKHQKFNVYFIAMPTFGYQRIKSNKNDNIIIESIHKVPAFSMNRLGVRIELGAERPISNRVKIFGGLLYYQRKQTIDYVERTVDSTAVSAGPNGEVIVEPQFSSTNRSFEYELKNIGLQIGFNYKLSQRKFLQTLGTGLELQFALNKLNQNQDKNFITNPSAYVFYNLYYRLQYPSVGRLKAVFQPTLNYSFYINQNLNAPFYVKPYGLGLNVGVTYNF